MDLFYHPDANSNLSESIIKLFEKRTAQLRSYVTRQYRRLAAFYFTHPNANGMATATCGIMLSSRSFALWPWN